MVKKKTISGAKNLLKIFNVFKTHTLISIIVTTVVVAAAGTTVILFNPLNKSINKTCEVKFDSSGGSLVKGSSIKCGNTVDEPTSPTKEGFKFKYWEYNGKKYDFKSQVLIDLLLTAIYEVEDGIEIVTITFDTSGAGEIKPAEIKKGTALTKPSDPVMPGYKFVGWYKDYIEYDFSTIVNENITLKAKWEETNNNVKGKKDNIKTNTTSSKYKCMAEFRSDVPEQNVTLGYSDHVNWTWSTYGSHSSNECYITYKTSNADIANVSEKGIITTKKAGKVYISECANDTETNKELICFKGKLNIIDPNDTTTVTSKYDEIVNKYIGYTWYLEGYADAFIIVKKYKSQYETMGITPTNVDIRNGGAYPESGPGSITVWYNNWDADISKYNITFGDNYISIGTPKGTLKFTKTKGTINRFTDSMFYQSLGKWYVYNHPDSYLEVYKVGDDTSPTQYVKSCIRINALNISSLQCDDNHGEMGCGDAESDEILKMYGITVSNGEMTIKNSNGSLKLYKTQKTIPVSGVSLNKNSINLVVGENENLSYNITPSDAYNKQINWSTSNSSVATVSNGTVTAVGKGTATITITTQDGNKKATCNVTVTSIDVTGVSLNPTSLTLVKGSTSNINVIIEPSNATNKNVSWSTSNPSVATVSNGIVNAVSNGNAVITATTQDGNKQATCNIIVSNPPVTGTASIGISTVASGNSITRGVSVSVKASGGTNSYNYYYIKLYKNGTLIGQTSNTSSNSLFIAGHTNGSYYAEFEIHDSEGTVYNGTSNTTTVSGY